MIRVVIMLSYGKQTITEADIASVVATLKSNFLTQGPAVVQFEKALADYCNVKYAVAFCNGTAALHAAYKCSGLREHGFLMTSPITFCATANAALYCGCDDIKWIDIDLNGNLRAANIDFHYTNAPVHLVPVHYAGNPCNMELIHSLVKKYQLCEGHFTIIEDACHALGAKYRDGSKVGSCKYSLATVFSFHPVKSITTGEGGAVTTNDYQLYLKLKEFRTHGITDGSMHSLGYNYRMTDIQAALGLSQLNQLDDFILKRQGLYNYYLEHFPRGVKFLAHAEGSSLHLMSIFVDADKRYQIMEKMKEAGINPQIHYRPVYQHPYYQKRFGLVSCPTAEVFAESGLTLPLYPSLTFDDVGFVCNTMNRILNA